MKKFLIVLLLVNLFNTGKAQTIAETIDYINYQIIESTKTVSNYNRLSTLKLSKEGKLTVDTYMIILGKTNLIESRSCYIKQLSFDTLKEINASSETTYYVGLKCIDNSNCILRQVKTQTGDFVDKIGFTIYNKNISVRIKNAIKYLLKESQLEENFKEKDPFEN